MPMHWSVRPLTAMVCGLAAVGACGAEPEQAPPQQPPPPAVPHPAPTADFAVALWPGEGIPVFDAVGNPLPLRTAPRADAVAHDTLRPAPGTRISYDSTSHRTAVAVPITVLRSDTLTGRDFGDVVALSREVYHGGAPIVQLPVNPASRLMLLQHRAEGTCFVRVDTRVLEADPCPMFDTGAFRPDGTPVTEWWIFASGGARGGGWVLVSDSTVTVAGRRF